MRHGFTTGSCAAAAAKAACYMLLSGNKKESITIETPKGIPFQAELLEIEFGTDAVSCCVKKDGGDDPDITTGALIRATVSIVEGSRAEDATRTVMIRGGKGVGTVTKPGLDQPVGEAAINHVPREMMTAEVTEVMELFDFHGTMLVEISVPEGEALAASTFNPRLGIEGGISILGTSGVVEPMSEQALLDTIKVECRQKKALGCEVLPVALGNYGLQFVKENYDMDLDTFVKCSNFVGATIDMAVELGFNKMLLVGHIGKLVKVAGGMMNTHSKEGDCRMEIIGAAAIQAGASAECVRQILDAVTTEDAVRILEENDLKQQVMEDLLKKIEYYLNKRGKNKIAIHVILFSSNYGLLAESA